MIFVTGDRFAFSLLHSPLLKPHQSSGGSAVCSASLALLKFRKRLARTVEAAAWLPRRLLRRVAFPHHEVLLRAADAAGGDDVGDDEHGVAVAVSGCLWW